LPSKLNPSPRRHLFGVGVQPFQAEITFLVWKLSSTRWKLLLPPMFAPARAAERFASAPLIPRKPYFEWVRSVGHRMPPTHRP